MIFLSRPRPWLICTDRRQELDPSTCLKSCTPTASQQVSQVRGEQTPERVISVSFRFCVFFFFNVYMCTNSLVPYAERRRRRYVYTWAMSGGNAETADERSDGPFEGSALNRHPARFLQARCAAKRGVARRGTPSARHLFQTDTS